MIILLYFLHTLYVLIDAESTFHVVATGSSRISRTKKIRTGGPSSDGDWYNSCLLD